MPPRSHSLAVKVFILAPFHTDSPFPQRAGALERLSPRRDETQTDGEGQKDQHARRERESAVVPTDHPSSTPFLCICHHLYHIVIRFFSFKAVRRRNAITNMS